MFLQIMDLNMLKTDTEKVLAAREKLGGVDVSQPDSIRFSLLNKQSNKSTKLLANSGDTVPLDGRHRWYEYEFKSEVFITSISIESENYSSLQKFEIEWYRNGKLLSFDEISINDRVVETSINDLIDEIRFRPSRVWLKDPKINKVEIRGFEKEDINEYIEKLDQIENYKNIVTIEADKIISKAERQNDALEKLESQIVIVQESITGLKNEEAEIQGRIGRLGEQEKSVNENISQISEKEERIKSSISRAELTNEALERETKAIEKRIKDQERELQSLKDNVNMFPSDLMGFAEQSGSNISLYAALSLIPILVILIMFLVLIDGSADLTTITKDNPNVDVWTIFLTRLPYVAVATAIIGACYGISRAFISEVMRINQQKLALTKVSIIASEVARASEDELDLTEEERFELRAHLKMNILKDHLKSYVSPELSLPLPKSLRLGSSQQPNEGDNMDDLNDGEVGK